MRITTKGQVTIPQEIRDELGLLPNTEVTFDIVQRSVATPTRIPLPAWLECDLPHRRVKMVGSPRGDGAPFELDVQLVVEYYARFF